MRNRLRTLLLLPALAVALTGTPSAEANMICPYPIPCSTFNEGGCVYLYDPDTNCCVPTDIWCPTHCCYL